MDRVFEPNQVLKSDKPDVKPIIMVQVYLDMGNVYEYEVSDAMKGREHAAAIIATGYRHCEGDNLEWFPPHRIVKVKVTDGGESTKYRDNVRATKHGTLRLCL